MTGREHTRTAGWPLPRATRADLELPGAGRKRATDYGLQAAARRARTARVLLQPPVSSARTDAGREKATDYGLQATGRRVRAACVLLQPPASSARTDAGQGKATDYGLRATGYGQKGALRALATAYSLEPTASATSDSTSISFVSCGTVFVETMRRAPAPRSCSMASSAKRAWTAIQVTS